ncbi:MAG TPA: VWA domain-containing protein [Streptosporangiaceae bacterium]|nr:VWA domain-containing protein [Streptosporangiaceae bacterium]
MAEREPVAGRGPVAGRAGRPAAPLVEVLVAFSRELRAAGLPVGSGDILDFCSAMRPLDASDLVDLYWAGRATLVTKRDNIPVYDEVFRRFFLGAGNPVTELLTLRAQVTNEAEAVLQVPATDPGREGREEEQATLGLMASGAEALRHKSFAACTPEELAAVRRIMARIRLTPPRRRTRRTRKAPSGRAPDLRRTVRESMRTHGEPAELFFRRRRVRLRPLILILDVSGSMADYSRNLLQFAYSARRAAERVEVFCFGTRLTRITRELDHRRPDAALERAAQTVFDWEGGTRIGASLDAFVKGWGRRGLCRGGIVVICSDGLDRGDPDVLASAMERLARLSHKVVWMNPHKGDNRDFVPSTLGMMVAAPHVDLTLSGHDLSSLEQFATLLPTL